MMETVDPAIPKVFADLWSLPSSDKYYSVTATCFSTEMDDLILVDFFCMYGRNSLQSFKKFLYPFRSSPSILG